MISFSLFAALLGAGLLEITLPLILAYLLHKRIGAAWAVFLTGGIMFLLSLVRIPLNSAASILLQSLSLQTAVILGIAFPSLTAGLFEEGARWIAFRFLVKDHRIFNGIMYGAGHGGFESIFLVGLSVVSSAVIAYFYPNLLSARQLAVLNSTEPWLAFVGLYERIMVLTIQIALSLIVLRTLLTGKWRYLMTAVLIHFLVDFTSSYSTRFGVFVAEGVVTLWAASALTYILGIWKDAQRMPKL